MADLVKEADGLWNSLWDIMSKEIDDKKLQRLLKARINAKARVIRRKAKLRR